MLVRVRNFGDAHKEPFPEGSEGSKAFGAVTAAVAQIDAFMAARLTARRLSQQEKRAARLALAARIGAIARSAQVMAKSVPGADAKLPRPTRKSDVAVVRSGRLFLQESEPVKDAFIRCGLPVRGGAAAGGRQVRAGRQAINGRNARKTGAGVSQKGIRSALKNAVDTVQSLDVLVANVLGHDENLMNAWKRDRHVELAGKSAPVGAPSDHGGSVPVSPEQHPIPPAEAPTQHPGLAADR